MDNIDSWRISELSASIDGLQQDQFDYKIEIENRLLKIKQIAFDVESLERRMDKKDAEETLTDGSLHTLQMEVKDLKTRLKDLEKPSIQSGESRVGQEWSGEEKQSLRRAFNKFLVERAAEFNRTDLEIWYKIRFYVNMEVF